MNNLLPVEELGAQVPGEDEPENDSGLPIRGLSEIPLDDPLNGRREVRLPIVVAVRLSRAGIADGAPGERTYTDNISAHGARFFSVRFWQIGDEVRVTPRNDEAAVGSVVYCQALGDGRFAIGVKFQDGPVEWTAPRIAKANSA